MRQLTEEVRRVAPKLRNEESILTLLLTNIFKNLHFLKNVITFGIFGTIAKAIYCWFHKDIPIAESIHPYINFSNIFIHLDVFLTFLFCTKFQQWQQQQQQNEKQQHFNDGSMSSIHRSQLKDLPMDKPE